MLGLGLVEMRLDGVEDAQHPKADQHHGRQDDRHRQPLFAADLLTGFTDAELAQVTCPIGLPGIVDKAPEVIAASVVAQLLLLREASDSPRS